MTDDNDTRETVRRWLDTPLGRELLREETQLVEQALSGIFGAYCLQLGEWGEPHAFLRHARTQRKAGIVGSVLDQRVAEPSNVIGHLHRLPFLGDSVDAVLLPHTLEFSRRPHAILREVHRVLRADGHLIVLGFKPGGLWGLRRLLPGAGMPPGIETMIGCRQLCDWLELLDLHIHGLTRYCFRWPLPAHRGSSSGRWEERGRRWWPELAACYMLSAQKRVIPMTTVRMRWHKRRDVVAGLAKPTT